MTPGNVQGPCINVLNATSAQTQTTQTMNELESYANHYVYKNIDGELIKVTIAVSYLYTSFQQQKIVAQLPYKAFELNLDLSVQVKNYYIKYRYDF